MPSLRGIKGLTKNLMRAKICYVYSDVDYSHLVMANEEFLDKTKYKTSYVFISQTVPALYELFKDKGIEVYFIKYNNKKNLIRVIRQICKIFSELKPDIVHTHLIEASLAGLTAAKIKGIKRRIHTRHHSMENHKYYPHGVYYDKLINRLSKKIIAISKPVAEILIEKESVSFEKIEIIHHGFDFAQFNSDKAKAEELRQKYGLAGKYPVIGVISRFIHWKGIQYTIPAVAKLLEKYPNGKLVLANAKGWYSEEIKSLLTKHLHPSQYVSIEFEKCIFDLYKTFDVFVHVPIEENSEAYGQIYVEALALQVPAVFTLSGVANDFIKHGINALVVPHKDSDAIYEALNLILNDRNLRETITCQGKSDVHRLFDIRNMIAKLDSIYSVL